MLNATLLLSPAKPSNRAGLGLLPHKKYRLIRSQAERIIQARDDLQLSDHMAASRLKFRNGRDFAEAYGLLKSNGEALVLNNDWSGVEAVVYRLFPQYMTDSAFLHLLVEFNDPRAGQIPVDPLRNIDTQEEPTATARPGGAGGGKTEAAAAPKAAVSKKPWGGKDPTRPAFGRNFGAS